MAMNETEKTQDALLGRMFAKARADEPGVSEALFARILADAAREQRKASAGVAARPGLIRAAIAALGGWGSIGGLAAATLAGVWIGFGGMTAVAPQLGQVLGTDTAAYDLYPTEDYMFTADLAIGGLDG